jgi:hypothetical protein
MDANKLTMQFDNPVNANQLIVTGIIIQNAGPSQAVPLSTASSASSRQARRLHGKLGVFTASSASSANGRTIVVDLGTADSNRIKVESSLATVSNSDAYLPIAVGAVKYMSDQQIVAIVQQDVYVPELDEFDLDIKTSRSPSGSLRR